MRHPYSTRFTLRSLFALTLGLGAVPAAFAQTPIGLSSATAIYTQNFDGMTPTGTTYPAGWSGVRLAGTGAANETLPTIASDGSGSTISGGVYNVGTAAASDRALGSVASGTTVAAFGAAFINNTGAPITRMNIAARLEQWRSGSSSGVDEVTAFEYSTNATSLSTGTWTVITSLDLTERNTGSTIAVGTDGNAAANSAAIAGSIMGLNLAVNSTIWIRWRDTDNTGADALMAVDNFALSTGNIALATRKGATNSAVSVFPNPAAEVVSIRINGKGTNAPVTVTDLTGRTVLSGTAAADGTFSLRSLPAGTYFIVVNDGTASSAHKVIKR